MAGSPGAGSNGCPAIPTELKRTILPRGKWRAAAIRISLRSWAPRQPIGNLRGWITISTPRRKRADLLWPPRSREIIRRLAGAWRGCSFPVWRGRSELRQHGQGRLCIQRQTDGSGLRGRVRRNWRGHGEPRLRSDSSPGITARLARDEAVAGRRAIAAARTPKIANPASDEKIGDGQGDLDHDDFRSNRSKVIIVIDSNSSELDAGEKVLTLFLIQL